MAVQGSSSNSSKWMSATVMRDILCMYSVYCKVALLIPSLKATSRAYCLPGFSTLQKSIWQLCLCKVGANSPISDQRSAISRRELRKSKLGGDEFITTACFRAMPRILQALTRVPCPANLIDVNAMGLPRTRPGKFHCRLDGYSIKLQAVLRFLIRGAGQ